MASASGYTDIETTIAEWAAGRQDIYVVLVVGSRARMDPPADDFSDLDLIFFVQDPLLYTATGEWLAEFGDPVMTVLEHELGTDPEWFVLYPGGYKVDCLFTQVKEPAAGLDAMLSASAYLDVLVRGARVLLPAGAHLPPDLPAPAPGRPLLPAASELNTMAAEIWLASIKAAALIRRADLWRARQLLDGALKKRLLVLIEWHARASFGSEHDTWYDGRYLAMWAAPWVVEALPDSCAVFEQRDMARALRASMALAGRLLREIARELDLRLAKCAEQAALDWVAAALDF